MPAITIAELRHELALQLEDLSSLLEKIENMEPLTSEEFMEYTKRVRYIDDLKDWINDLRYESPRWRRIFVRKMW